MSEQRFIDANAFDPDNPKMREVPLSFGDRDLYAIYWWLKQQPTIDPETLPIVRELREKLARYEKAEQEGRLVKIPEPSDDGIKDPLEPMKIGFALKSEVRKLMYRKENNPSSISQLDYTIIAALEAALKERETQSTWIGERDPDV